MKRVKHIINICQVYIILNDMWKTLPLYMNDTITIVHTFYDDLNLNLKIFIKLLRAITLFARVYLGQR